MFFVGGSIHNSYDSAELEAQKLNAELDEDDEVWLVFDYF